MPITKTAKRALRSSKRKEAVNKRFTARLEVSLRTAEKNPTEKNIVKAISLTDRASKKNLIHKNKAARIKSRLSKLKKENTKKSDKKTSKKKKK